MLKDSSELREALDLFRDFLNESAPAVSRRTSAGLGQILSDKEGRQAAGPELSASDVVTAPVLVTAAPTPQEPPAPVEGEFREERLENSLIAMCSRGGFEGAVLADDSGLPVAVHNSPVGNEQIAAFTAILGDALSKAGRYLQQHGADYISMDINYEDKVVVRSFDALGQKMYLMVLCKQEMDERAEVEMSLQQMISILTA